MKTSQHLVEGAVPKRKRDSWFYTAVWFSIDALAIFIAASAAFTFIAFTYGLFGASYASAQKLLDERLGVIAAVTFGLAFYFLCKGHHNRRLPFWIEAKEVMQASALALMIEGFLLYTGRADVSRLLTCSTWVLAPLFILAARMVYKSIARKLHIGTCRIIVVGDAEGYARAQHLVAAETHLNYSVIEQVDTKSADAVIIGMQVSNADTAMVAMRGNDDAKLVAKLRERKVPVIVMPQRMGLPVGMNVQYVMGHSDVLFVDHSQHTSVLPKFLKRIFDITIASIVLAIAAMPMLVIAALVRRDGNPAIFAHSRVGQGGKAFNCFKFRSMRPNAERHLEVLLHNDMAARKEWEETQKLKNDPRVTDLGKFLRKTGLDELPQLFNVLRGDMSLVGPRPVTASELNHYGADAERYFAARPGITGLWQVSGRNDTTYSQRVGLDVWYVDNWSPWHDLVILLKTIPAVLFRKGAY